MSETASTRHAPEPHRQNVQPTDMTAWVGLVAFAGAMMLLLGMFHAGRGLRRAVP